MPGIFERAMDTVRSGLGRGTLRAAELAPNGATNAGEMIGSAGAGGGVAVGGSVAAKLLVAGTAAVCAMGGQEICARLFATQPPRRHQDIALDHRRQHHTTKPAPSPPARLRIPQPAPKPAVGARQLAQPGARSLEKAKRQQQPSSAPASAPSAPSAPSGSSTPAQSPTSTPPAPRDPTFDQSAPSRPSSSPSSSSTGGGSSGGGSSGGDSTFNNLP
jgi:uncharacterized membrane protein YgcG